MARRRSMLHSLEVVVRRHNEGKSYQISPRLLDKSRLDIWRSNIIHTGTEDDKERYANAIMSEAATNKLPLRPEGC